MSTEQNIQADSSSLPQEEDQMETLKRLQNTLERREGSLSILTIQKIDHQQQLEKKNLELASIKIIHENLTQKLLQIEENLNNQRISKLLLFEKLQKLQDLIDQQAKESNQQNQQKTMKQPEQNNEVMAYANFYQENLKGSNQKQPLLAKYQKPKVQQKIEEKNEEDIDVDEELKALGLDNILHQY